MKEVYRPAARAGENAPAVSVVMGVYNGARFLRQAVDSILGQTLPDLEFVIVDDASTDDTPLILDSVQDTRIVRLVNERNLGLTRSLNRAIRASSGRFLARQDADDWSLPDRLDRQVAYLNVHPEVGLVGTASRWVDDSDRVLREWYPETDPSGLQRLLLRSIPFLHGTFLLRRECLADLGGGYDESIPVAQDCDLVLRLSEAWDVANLPGLLYVHRRHDGTVTSMRSGEQGYYLKKAQRSALERRLSYGWARLGLRDRRRLPPWLSRMARRRLAQRYVWWSAGARASGMCLALQFVIIAGLLDPTSRDLWAQLSDTLRRTISRWSHWRHE